MDPSRLAQLLDLSAALGTCANLATLGPALFQILREFLFVDRVALWLESGRSDQAICQWAAQLTDDGILSPVEPLENWVELTRNLQMDVWDLEEVAGRGCQNPVIPILKEKGFPAWVLLPLRTQKRLVGGLALASSREGIFQEAGASYLASLARVVASHALSINRLDLLDHLNCKLSKERDQQRVLLDITNDLMVKRDPRELFQAIASSLRDHLHYDAITLVLGWDGSGDVRIHFTDFPTGRGFIQENRQLILPEGPSQRAMASRRAQVYSQADLDSLPTPIDAVFRAEGIHSLCVVPLISRDRAIGALNFGSRQQSPFLPEALELLSRVGAQVAIALDNAYAYEEIQTLKDKLAEEKLYLQEEIGKDFGMEIVGQSPAFQRVLRQAETVADSGATVLILGETGTGKELVARAIHQLSPRKDHSFVQINCASIPTGLVESELFGYEKGAFTGAITPKSGRLELAHQGTLFLDEIGDMPLELQPKLLRAIQEREFERLGSSRTRRVDLRLITATNCDLAAMVEARTFRADLFYRLNVFPIQLPPLRERKDDIPALTRYFTQKFAQSMRRPIDTIPTRAMEALIAWDWPGNIRELENIIERSVILSPGRELLVPVAELRSRDAVLPSGPLPTLVEAERDHILKALQESRGKVGGPQGAAARLGMKRTTLQSRMLKWGISAK